MSLFPFISIRAVVNSHIALAATIFAFVTVAWGEDVAAANAVTVLDNFETIEKNALSFEHYSGIFVNPISESTDTGNRSDMQNPSFGIGFVVLSDAPTINAVLVRQLGNCLYESFGTGERNRRVAFGSYVNTTISVKYPSHKMIRIFPRDEVVVSQRPDAGRKIHRANGNSSALVRASYRMLRAQRFSKEHHMIGVYWGQPEHKGAFCRTTVCVEKPNPISLFLAINGVEKVFINKMNSGAGHGTF